ncbi:MAG: glycosyltransferase [Thermoplasmata archaeon]|nr:glycosyltransferase [Thermoplasmata archaeon]
MPRSPADPTSAAETEPRSAERAAEPKRQVLNAGVVAFNEERHVESALRSLLRQPLPEGFRWGTIWVVASGCSDRTVSIVQSVAATEPRVVLVEERVRRGKAQALAEVFRRAEGGFLVLLNADALAHDGALGALLDAAVGSTIPAAVMARPVVPERSARGAFGGAIELLWALHHELHVEMIDRGEGTHLSDELLLLRLRRMPEIPSGVINDGSFLGAWLTRERGTLRYAPNAQVSIQVPRSMREHLVQRRRILAGHAQVEASLGISPTTFPSYFRAHPSSATQLLRRTLKGRPNGSRDLLLLTVAELAAVALSLWARIPPRRNFVLWERVGLPTLSPRRTEA